MTAQIATLLVTTALAGLPADWQELTPFGVDYTSRGFEEIADERGVTVFKHRDSKIVKLAAEGRINARPADVRAALLAYDKQPGVIERVSKTNVLSRGEDKMLVYQRLNLPVIDDRDYTLWVAWGEHGDTLWIKYWSATHRGPQPVDGAVRVTTHSGSWQLKPLDGGAATLLRYQVSIDLSGWLPKWMAKAGAGDEVPGVFEDVCKLLAQENKEALACRL